MMLYVADYLADTRNLTCEQHGAYLLLLMSMWREGGYIPGDERSLSRLACLSLKQWRRIGGRVEALLSREGDKITQRRLLFELRKASVTSEVRRAAAHRSHEARALKTHNQPRAIAEPLHQQTGVQTGGNQNQNHNHKEERKKKGPPANAVAVVAVVPLPAWVNPEAWNGYSEMRRRKRAHMTERAKTLVIKELEQLKLQGHDPNAVLDQSTKNGWTGVFELKSKDGNHAKQSAYDKFFSATATYIDEQFSTATNAGDASEDRPPAGEPGYPLLPA